MTLIEKLRAVEGNRPDSLGICTMWHRNPEGPQAADRIEKLEAAIRNALDAPMIDHGQKGRGVYDILRAALSPLDTGDR